MVTLSRMYSRVRQKAPAVRSRLRGAAGGEGQSIAFTSALMELSRSSSRRSLHDDGVHGTAPLEELQLLLKEPTRHWRCGHRHDDPAFLLGELVDAVSFSGTPELGTM